MHWLYQNLIWIQTRLCSAAESKCALLQKLKQHGRDEDSNEAVSHRSSIRKDSRKVPASPGVSAHFRGAESTQKHTHTLKPPILHSHPLHVCFHHNEELKGNSALIMMTLVLSTHTHTHTHTHLWPRPSSAPPPSHLCKHAHNHSTQQSFVVKFMS